MADSNGHQGKPADTGSPANGGGNGSGNGSGAIAKALANAKAVQARATEELKGTIKAPEKTDVWKSVLRVKHDETPRSRALGVLC